MTAPKVPIPLPRLLRVLLFVCATFIIAVPGFAQEDSPEEALAASRKELGQIQALLKAELPEDRLVALRDRALALQGRADLALEQLEPRLAGVDARIEQLGKPPEDSPEAAEVKKQRADLDRERAAIDAAVKGARLLGVEAAQTADQVAVLRRTQFNARLGERTSSILSPSLWEELAAGLPRDLRRIQALGIEGWTRLEAALEGPNRWNMAAGLLVAFILAVPVRRKLRQMGRHEAIEHVPAGKLRRSGFAVWSTVVGTATFGLAAQAVHLGFSWAGALTPRWEDLAVSLVVAISWGAFVAALGRAILANTHPGWRLLPVSDALAGCLKSYPVIIALVATFGYLLERVNAIAGTGLSTALVSNCIIALGYSLAGGCLLLAGQRSPCAEAAAEAGDPEAPSAWRSIRAAVWVAITLPILGVLFGYIALAGFVARQTLWIGLVGMTLYLLLHFADDLFTTLFDTKCRFGRFFRNNFGLGQNRLEQLGVLLSAGTRVTLLFLGVAAILAPFGTGPTVLVGDLGRFGAGITIGEVTISPIAVLTAISVFALGIVIARLVRRWLNDKYLPKTGLDRGVQDSVSTVVGYAGIILAGLWALNALGLGIERLALVASALSVGIGFGLQAIVQNFISGLILLAERPVKVGDWVAIGDQEGDIRKINVRATEIQLGDRSTLVVPNSELITKTVRNVTMASPLGKVAIMIGVSHDADAGEVRAILLETLTAHPAMKADPAPGVFFDSIRDMGLFFNAFGFVASPRDAYPVKSEILFELLERFRKAGIEIARPRQDVRVISPMPEDGGGAEARPRGRFLQ